MNGVHIRYTGSKLGAALIVCPSGNRYRYGGRFRDLFVSKPDADFLLSRPDFQLAGEPQPSPVPEPTPSTAMPDVVTAPTKESPEAPRGLSVSSAPPQTEESMPPASPQPRTPEADSSSPLPASLRQSQQPSGVETSHYNPEDFLDRRIDEVIPLGYLKRIQLEGLERAGIVTFRDILKADYKVLLSVPHIGPLTAERLMSVARGEYRPEVHRWTDPTGRILEIVPGSKSIWPIRRRSPREV